MDCLVETLADLSHLNLKDLIVEKDTHNPCCGAYSEVYRAWSLRHGVKVAVKQTRVFMAKDDIFLKRLAKEIRIWATLNHGNVLPLLGYAVDDERVMPDMISEWMVNGTLHDYIPRISPCSFETCSMLLGIASGLAYLHFMGVIHADLKSHNILISAAKTPMLADFGLSIILNQTVTSTGTKGTVRWIAREIYAPCEGASQKYNEASDMWALGMVSYELISGKVPYYDKKEDAQVILAVVKGELPGKPPDCGDPQVFTTLWDLCCLCWSMDPSLRPSALESTSTLADIEIKAWRNEVINWLENFDSSLLILDTNALSDKVKRDICWALLTYAGVNYPEIQLAAFRTILSNAILWLNLQNLFQDICVAAGETRQSAISSWKRPGVHYSDEWLRLHHVLSRCLDPNAVLDFLGRSIYRYDLNFSYGFQKLLSGCREATDEMLVLKLIGLNWKKTSTDFALHLIKRGYCDDAISKFAIAIRSRIEAARADIYLLSSWDLSFDLLVFDFLCEMFKSVAFLRDEKCEVISRDARVRKVWLHAYAIYCITRSEFGKQNMPKAFRYCSMRAWRAYCSPWHAGAQVKFRKQLMELDDIYGNSMREHFPPAIQL